MTDDRPSIAELQRMRDRVEAAREQPHGEIAQLNRALRNAAPVLLEIAAAALAWRDRPITDDAVAPLERLLAALGRVLP